MLSSLDLDLKPKVFLRKENYKIVNLLRNLVLFFKLFIFFYFLYMYNSIIMF